MFDVNLSPITAQKNDACLSRLIHTLSTVDGISMFKAIVSKFSILSSVLQFSSSRS